MQVLTIFGQRFAILLSVFSTSLLASFSVRAHSGEHTASSDIATFIAHSKHIFSQADHLGAMSLIAITGLAMACLGQKIVRNIIHKKDHSKKTIISQRSNSLTPLRHKNLPQSSA